MSFVNGVLRSLFDILLAPFREYPLVGLIVVSLLIAIAVLWVFKATSDQARLDAVKRQIHACLYEIRLFNDDPRAILRAQREVLSWNGRYLWLSLPPLLCMAAPLAIVVSHLQTHYGYRGIGSGETALVAVELRDAGRGKPAATLTASGGIRVETAALWVPVARTLTWRIRGGEPGEHQLRIDVDGTTETKTVLVGEQAARRSPIRPPPEFMAELLNPSEAPLSTSSPIRSIAVGYPQRRFEVAGLSLHWLVVFFGVSMGFALALRRSLGVTI